MTDTNCSGHRESFDGEISATEVVEPFVGERWRNPDQLPGVPKIGYGALRPHAFFVPPI